MFRDFGVGQYLVQEKDLTDAKIRTVFGTSLIIGWLLAAAIFFSRFAVADFYSKPIIADIMALLSISFMIIPFGQPLSALMRRERLYGRLALIGLSSTFVSITASITAAIMGKGGYITCIRLHRRNGLFDGYPAVVSSAAFAFAPLSLRVAASVAFRRNSVGHGGYNCIGVNVPRSGNRIHVRFCTSCSF